MKMARYQIIVSYDGTEFVGSQRQLNSRTVQSELEKGLRKIKWNGKSLLLAGRTDTGVHASGQVAVFDLDWKHSLEDLGKALNASLPLDMAISDVRIVADEFHPRFDATSRRYRYCLFCQPTRDPLRERYAWRVWPAVSDLHALAEIWPGTHDFAAFGTPPRPGKSTVRTVLDGNAFLYHMVRRIVCAQVAVCQGRISVQDLTRALENQSEIPVGPAPAHGLTLVEVRYDVLE
jgi:tRNA pseudouridine38-40 synthase